MAKNLFVGSIAWATTEEGLKAHFETVGVVNSAVIIKDNMTDRSKGFGFVEMATEDEAKAAVEQLNGKDLDGRELVINEARPKEEN